MKEISESPEAQLQIIATNTHLSPDFGMTVNEIEADGFKVDVKIPSLVPGDSANATVKSMARVEEGLADAFDKLKPDMVVILGDRYEALAAASAAVVFNIPVVHLHGGETTQGAFDDAFRHAITKLSSFHFAATPQYVDKIISMGEDPSNVFHSGAPGAEPSPYELDPLEMNKSAEDFYNKTGLRYGEPFILFAFHPVTLLPDKGVEELKATLMALDSFISEGYKILLTLPNSDPGNEEIRNLIRNYFSKFSEDSVIFVDSLGSRLFHYAMETASAMIGNSSAALIEAPSRRLPSINVGIRQKGRAHGFSVIDVAPDKGLIENALRAALSLEMKSVLMGLTLSSLNPYFKENSAHFIAHKILEMNLH